MEKEDLNENQKQIKKRIKRTSQGSLGKSNLAQYHSYCRINHLMSLIGLCVFLIASFVDSDSARHVAEAIDSTNGNVSSGSSGADFGRNLIVN